MKREPERCTGKEIKELSRLISRYISGEVREFGIGHGSYNMLMAVSELEGCSLDEAAGMIRIDKAAASRMATRLEQRGLVTKESDGSDRRFCHITCTEKGQRACVRMREIRMEIEGILDRGLSNEERRSFMDILGRMKESLGRELGV